MDVGNQDFKLGYEADSIPEDVAVLLGRAGGGPVIFAEGTPANIPPRLSEATHTDLIKSFKSLSVKPERPVRPGYGTMGTPITLSTYFFAVKLPKGPIYDYH